LSFWMDGFLFMSVIRYNMYSGYSG
jgi:hypothetical protein